MKLLICLVCLSSVASAETVAYIGKDASNTVVRKDVLVNNGSSLGKMRNEYPALTWTVASEGEAAFDTPVDKQSTAKDRYKTAVTVDERLSIIEDVLQLKEK